MNGIGILEGKLPATPTYIFPIFDISLYCLLSVVLRNKVNTSCKISKDIPKVGVYEDGVANTMHKIKPSITYRFWKCTIS